MLRSMVRFHLAPRPNTPRRRRTGRAVLGVAALVAACDSVPPSTSVTTRPTPSTTTVPTTSATTVPKGPGEVRFVRTTDTDINGAVWTVSGAGGAERRLYSTPAGDSLLAISPDGTRHAFTRTTSDRDGTSHLFLADVDGSNERELTFGDASKARWVRWSPDGSRLVYAKQGGPDPPYFQLFVIGADGTGERRLVEFPAEQVYVVGSSGDQWPTFSPDGTSVAFFRDGRTERGLFTVKVDGTGLRRLSSVADGQADWSPDGKTIVVSQTREFGSDIVLIDVATGARRALTRASSEAERASRCRTGHANDRNVLPHFSPDGTRILYASNRNHLRDDDTEELVIVPVAGGEARNLTSHPSTCRPDGTGRTRDEAIAWLD